MLDVTLHLKEIGPVEIRSPADSPVLKLLCQGLVKGSDPASGLMYLEFGDSRPSVLYFPCSSLEAIESSAPIPAEYFAVDDRDAIPNKLEQAFGCEWINWAQENVRRGCDKDELFATMLDAGFDHGLIRELLLHDPTRPVAVKQHPARESILPVSDIDFPGLRRVDSDYIELYTIDGFLTKAECDDTIGLIGDRLTRSSVVGYDTPQNSRTSYTCHVSDLEDNQRLSHSIRDRICSMLGTDPRNAEPLQAQVYESAQEYQPHYDYFTEEIPGYLASDGQTRGGQRLWSVIIYLSDSVIGSGTRFPDLNLELNPTKGTAILWRNLYPSGNPNPYTLHQGLPARHKKKIILTQWIRDSQTFDESADDMAAAQSSAVSRDDSRARYLDLMERVLLGVIYEDPSLAIGSTKKFDPIARREGLDWPSTAHTMIGFHRLRNIHELVEKLLEDGVPGDLIETGVWRGGACIYMRAILAAHRITDRRVWVADSFDGLPPPDTERYPADSGDQHHSYAKLKVSLEEVKRNFEMYGLLDNQVQFLPGWFKDTLADAPIERLALLRLDGDMYGSTMEAISSLYDKLSRGGFVIVDDYNAVPACKQAIDDFRERRGITDPIQHIDRIGVFWRKR